MQIRRPDKQLEVCIDTPGGLAASIDAGADRVELCAALGLGGLTPGPGLMAIAAQSSIAAHAMIRPVSGGFVADAALLAAMLADISGARQHQLAGVVIGVLTPDRALDTPKMRKLIAEAEGMEVTLHRAIDLCIDPLSAIDQAVELGISRVLTSGGAHHAIDGVAMIRAMVERADGRLTVMAGSGITPQNVAALTAATGVTDVHASCAKPVPENVEVSAFGFGPATRRKTDVAMIRAMRVALDDDQAEAN